MRGQAWEDVFLVTVDRSRHAFGGADAGAEADADAVAPSIMRDTSAVRLRHFSDHERVGWARGSGSPFIEMQTTRTALWLVWDTGLLGDAVAPAREVADGRGDGEWGSFVCTAGDLC